MRADVLLKNGKGNWVLKVYSKGRDVVITTWSYKPSYKERMQALSRHTYNR